MIGMICGWGLGSKTTLFELCERHIVQRLAVIGLGERKPDLTARAGLKPDPHRLPKNR